MWCARSGLVLELGPAKRAGGELIPIRDTLVVLLEERQSIQVSRTWERLYR